MTRSLSIALATLLGLAASDSTRLMAAEVEVQPAAQSAIGQAIERPFVETSTAAPITSVAWRPYYARRPYYAYGPYPAYRPYRYYGYRPYYRPYRAYYAPYGYYGPGYGPVYW